VKSYNYKAIDKKGKITRGTLSAVHEIDLESRLSQLGLDLVDSEELKSNISKLFGSKKITHKELILFCVQLEQLDRSGVPLLDALTDMRDSSETPAMKNLMADITETVKNGTIFSKALAKHPEIFDEVFVGLVAAGEKTGQLYDIFFHLASHLKWVHEIRRSIKKATTYPIFLLCLMMGIISLMMLFVIPKLSSFLLSQNFELPIYTKALIATSHFFQHYWYIVFAFPVLLVIMIKVMCKQSYAFAYGYDKFKLMIPVIGSTILRIEMARFCRFFSITYKSGIGIMDCLTIAQGVVNNKVIKVAIETAQRSVGDGISLTNALKAIHYFPTLVIRMVKVGEDSGNLDKTLENVNFFYDKEVADSVSGLLGMIQPALTILMGTLMLWITIAVFGPLYGSFSKMNF
jgi:type IV pilus assembly protein PilC